MKKILFIVLIIALFSVSVVYGQYQTTTETFHVTDKRMEYDGYNGQTQYFIDTEEYGDISISMLNYNKIRIGDIITVELKSNSNANLIEINGQPV